MTLCASRMSRRRTVLLALAMALAGDAGAQTSSGLSPVAYTRPEALTDALLAAQPIPRALDGTPDPNGRIVSMCIGMSNARDYCQAQIRLLKYDAEFQPVVWPTYRFHKAAQSGHTAQEWADPNDSVWSYAVSSLENAGASVYQVQHVHAYMTQAFPETHGVMTVGQVQAIVRNAKAWFPNVRVVEFSGIQWNNTTTGRAPVWSLHGDDALLASLVGSVDDVLVEYTQVYADGDVPNLQVASPRFPDGLTWVVGDWEADRVHPTLAGADKMAATVIDRWRRDPAKAWLWIDGGNAPAPAPIETAGPFDATVEREGTLCRVVLASLSAIVRADLAVCEAAGLR